MRRLALFLPLAIAFVVAPFAVTVQQMGKVWRIGVLTFASTSPAGEFLLFGFNHEIDGDIVVIDRAHDARHPLRPQR